MTTRLCFWWWRRKPISYDPRTQITNRCIPSPGEYRYFWSTKRQRQHSTTVAFLGNCHSQFCPTTTGIQTSTTTRIGIEPPGPFLRVLSTIRYNKYSRKPIDAHGQESNGTSDSQNQRVDCNDFVNDAAAKVPWVPNSFQEKRLVFHTAILEEAAAAAETCRKDNLDLLQQCWASTSFSVNPKGDCNIDTILQGLHSPAPQSFFVIDRALNLLVAQDSDSDRMLVPQGIEKVLQICHYLLKEDHYQFIVRTTLDPAGSHHWIMAGLHWHVIPKDVQVPNDSGWKIVHLETPQGVVKGGYSRTTTIELAADLLSMVQGASETQSVVDTKQIHAMVQQLQQRLQITLGTDIRGRAAADTAFTLALAGIVGSCGDDEDDKEETTRVQNGATGSSNDNATSFLLYDILTEIVRLELVRVSGRSSKGVKDILQTIEKLAAAGVEPSRANGVYKTALQILNYLEQSSQQQGRSTTASKHMKKRKTALSLEEQYSVMKELKEDPCQLSLLSPRPLVWLWRFAARQSKARNEDFSPVPHETQADSPTQLTGQGQSVTKSAGDTKSHSWWMQYKDSTKPLVVDIGCGFGVSLLGMASLPNRLVDRFSNNVCNIPLGDKLLNLADCNFVGGDLSQLGIRFGQGISRRWNLQDRLQFAYTSAEQLLEQVDGLYPGPIALVLLQFPTPYRLIDNDRQGNHQLPSDLESGFMVNAALMQRISNLLHASHGHLLLQSNCEDVAITMRDMALKAGLVCVSALEPVQVPRESDACSGDGRLPQRTLEWIRLGGGECRAVGPEWSRVPLLPMGCATETEIACRELNQTPIHRCLLRSCM